ncbi:MauE/DoxX family redox-associated membrane protein [Paenibacillus sp. MDMC362]|uniref:MauE/DoxX family redox-associated membrane protein n=1 Tax=Paenibacillus sp. MDMC362 TaxID=2977365 RepID=UPI000DC230CF|nr:MauE/DoxX family redox-associated membrane protein [Paenibacillus sp. MDMC362]RAR43590.1 hypothetical protein DP091_13915 [Paenibacillus sp. MDMC362]
MSMGSLCLLYLTVIFVFSGVSKLLSLADFRKTIERLQLPAGRLPIVPVLICAAEIAAGTGLLFSWSRILAQIAIFIMLAGFAYAVYQARVVQQQEITCSCFGSWSNETLGMITVVKIAFLGSINALIWLMSEPVNLFSMPGPEMILSLLSAIGLVVISLVMLNVYSFETRQEKGEKELWI